MGVATGILRVSRHEMLRAKRPAPRPTLSGKVRIGHFGAWARLTGRRAFAAAAAALLLATAAPAPTADARGVAPHIIIDAATGETLGQSRAAKRRHPASLTKMMTLYLAFDALESGALDPDGLIRVSRHAASMPPSELGLRRGDRISVRDAIRGSAIKSANDAAVALAEAIGGSEARFAQLMTAKAAQLGMRDTTFRNASGLTASGHLSTPRDMAILARRLHADFSDYYWMFSRRSIRIRGLRYRATNTLLGAAPGVDGIKTGYTRRAGHNLAASALRGDRRIIVVLMGAGSRPVRDRDVAALLNTGFARLEALERSRSLRERQRREEERRRRDQLLVALRDAPTPRPRPAGAAAISRTAASFQGETATIPALGQWRVQVGAFRSAAGATRAAEAALSSAQADRATPLVESVRTEAGAALYRARLGGLDEASARALCDGLAAAQKPCALVPPAGWSGISG